MRLGILLVFVVACDAQDEAPRDVADVGDVDGSEVAQPPFTSCPIVDPDRDATCTFEGFCGVEPQACCGITSAGSGYGCSEGGVYWIADDTCHFTGCSPGCGPDEFATSETCTACSQIDALVHARLTTAAAAHGVCDTSADCVRASVDLRCGTYCDVAVNAAGLSGFQADAAVIDEQDCGFERGPGRGCETAGHCSPVADVRCVANVCRDVAACDPEVIATGAECDDGDACTVGETCVGAFACQGAARDCDDHDPCTDDACDPVSGCTYTDNIGSCEVADACSVGGICERGSCVASPVIGFTRVDTVPFRFPEAVSARADGTLVVGGWQGQFSPGESFILSYDARGAVTRTITLAQPERLSDLIALDDGGFLVAGEGSSGELGTKNDVRVVRLDAAGMPTWHFDVGSSGPDYAPRLAVTTRGASTYVLAAWFAEPNGEVASARAVLTDLTGATPIDVALGAAHSAFMPPDDYVQLAPINNPSEATGLDALFLTAHASAGETTSDVTSVVVTRIGTGGRVLGSFTVANADSTVAERVRGLIALDDGDIILWGTLDRDRWLRRVAVDGTQVWRQSVGAEAVVVRDGGLDLVGTDLRVGDPGSPNDGNGPWLGRSDLAGRDVERTFLPRGPILWDATPVASGGFGMIAHTGPQTGISADTRVWLRRTATALPGCGIAP